DVGEKYSRGFGHITTRQNMQFHFVKLHDVEPAMRLLADAGITTREACGNSVRNITACPYAGVAADERFDVTPYAEALTRYLLRQPISSTLPRKFKIAFEGCPVERELTRCRLSGEVPTLEIEPPPAESIPRWMKDGAPSVGHIASRVTAQKVNGPGIVPTIVPMLQPGDDAYARWRATNVRPQKQF